MGFMGLGHWSESDDAADFRGSLQEAIMKLTRKQLGHKANEFNTSGDINIAFMIADGLFDFLEEYEVKDDEELFLEVYKKLGAHKMDDTEVQKELEVLREKVKKFLAKNEIEIETSNI